MDPGATHSRSAAHEGIFATTHWSMVLTAGRGGSSASADALEQLCRTYWYPLYVYVRREGHSPEDAQDLTQEFFFRLMRRDSLAQVDPGKGKFRSFLLTAMKHFLANEWHRQRRVKRGGNVTFISFDTIATEHRVSEHLTDRSPEQVYERCWALAFLKQVLFRLRAETLQGGRSNHFDDLKCYLTAEEPPTRYAELASQHRTTEATLRKEVQRLRQRYTELVREELLRTVGSTSDVKDELCYLFKVLGA